MIIHGYSEEELKKLPAIRAEFIIALESKGYKFKNGTKRIYTMCSNLD